MNNNYYSQGYCVVKEFSTDLCLEDSFRRYLNLQKLMEGEFQDKGHLDKYLEEWLSPIESQHDQSLFSEEEKKNIYR